VYKRQIYQIAESNRIETFFRPNWDALPSTAAAAHTHTHTARRDDTGSPSHRPRDMQCRVVPPTLQRHRPLRARVRRR